MYKQVFTPDSVKLVLHLPASFVGKEIEITAEEKIHPKRKKRKSKNRLLLEKFYSKYSFDISRLKLTRDEANER